MFGNAAAALEKEEVLTESVCVWGGGYWGGETVGGLTDALVKSSPIIAFIIRAIDSSLCVYVWLN